MWERGGRLWDTQCPLRAAESRGTLIRFEFQEILNSNDSKREESDPKRSAGTAKIDHGQHLEFAPADVKQDSAVHTGGRILFR